MNALTKIILPIILVILSACSSVNDKDVETVKADLAACYEENCQLILEYPDHEDIQLERPFESCFYEYRKGCFDNFPAEFDVSFCDNFEYKAICVEDLAVLKRNIDLCKPIYEDSLDEAKLALLNESEKGILLMDYLNGGLCREYYEQAMDVINNNLSNCKDVMDTFPTIECYAKLISSFKSVNECEMYKDVLDSEEFGIDDWSNNMPVNNCYHWYAAINDNISVCRNVVDKVPREWCLKGYAILKHNASYCEGIENADFQGQCSAGERKGPYCSKYKGAEVCNYGIGIPHLN